MKSECFVRSQFSIESTGFFSDIAHFVLQQYTSQPMSNFSRSLKCFNFHFSCPPVLVLYLHCGDSDSIGC